jgi:small subunit ribosomal protein S21
LLQVLVKDNDVDLALKILKKKMQREGIFKTLKLKRAFEKPCDRNKRRTEERQKRRRKIQYKFEVHL